MTVQFKKYFFFFILAFVATTLAILKFSSPSQNPTPSPAPSIQTTTWNGITPGKTTLEQIKTIPGTEETQTQGGQTAVTIPRKEQGYPHEVIFNNNVAGLIKDIVLSGNLNLFIQKFGSPEAELWGEHQEVGFKTYVFANRGIAIVANKEDGSIFEIWYFQPMTLTQFLASWGKDLKSQQPNKGY